MSSDEDRRREGREQLTLKVEYDDADGLVHDYTANISQGGTFVVTDRLLPIGTAVKLVLSFPGLIKPLPITGTVKWHGPPTATPGAGEPDPDERGLGVQFDLEDPLIRDRLASLVSRIASGDPDLVATTMRVLVVEDNPHVANLIRDGLSGNVRRESAGRVQFEFEFARDGREAKEKALSARYDLLIIDIYLPVLDGSQVIKAVRANEGTAQLPIVAMSAGGSPARASAIAAGADFFLDKPMRLVDIVETIRKLTAPKPAAT